MIKYLQTFGFNVSNQVFADNSWYFRNALVRANYNDLQNDVHATTDFLEQFMENLLTGARHELKNEYLHVVYSVTPQSAKTEISKCKNCTLEELAILREISTPIHLLHRKHLLRQSENRSELSSLEPLNCKTKVCFAAETENETVSGKCSLKYHN